MKLIDADALSKWLEQEQRIGNEGFAARQYLIALTEVLEYVSEMPDAGCALQQEVAIARNLAGMAEGLMQAHKERADAAQAELDRLRDKYRQAWEYAHFAMDISDPEAKALYIDEIWHVMEGEG